GLVIAQMSTSRDFLRAHVEIFLGLDGGGDERLRLFAVADQTHDADLRGGHLDARIAFDLASKRLDVIERVGERLLRLRLRIATLEDLQMARAAADRALAQSPEGARFVSAEENQADRPEDDHEQRDRRAAAIAED